MLIRTLQLRGYWALAPGCTSVVVALVVVGVFAVLLAPTLQAQSWNETQCEITASTIRSYEDVEGDITWNAAISWRYRIGKHHYELVTHDPTAFNQALEKDEATALAGRFMVGERVPCFYDPQNPQRSVLDRSAPPWSALLCGALSLLGFLGSLLALLLNAVVIAVRRRRTNDLA